MKKVSLKSVGLCLLVAVSLLVMFPVLTVAAPPTQADDLEAKAEALYEEGMSLYGRGIMKEHSKNWKRPWLYTVS
jgi:hypothetical protein